MKYHQLKALTTVAATGSIRAASRSLFLSQAALTKAIRELEDELGLPLVIRSTHGAELTEFGRKLNARAQTIVSEMRRAQEDAAAMKGELIGSVAAAITPSIALTQLPLAYRAFRHRMPNAKVTLQEGFLATSLPRLRDGSLDFVVAAAPEDTLGAEFVHTELYSVCMMVMTRSASPHIRKTSLAEIHQAEWILNPSVESTNQQFLECFQKYGLPPPPHITACSSAMIVHALLQASDAVAAVPAKMREVEWFNSGITSIPIQDPLPLMSFRLITRRDSPLTPTATLLVDCIKDAIHRQQSLSASML